MSDSPDNNTKPLSSAQAHDRLRQLNHLWSAWRWTVRGAVAIILTGIGCIVLWVTGDTDPIKLGVLLVVGLALGGLMLVMGRQNRRTGR
jgi:hypothetical protein